jgi:hypothetical protein
MKAGAAVTPETEEYGISSFVYKARRPFHPERLYTDFLKKFFLTQVTDFQPGRAQVEELSEDEAEEGSEEEEDREEEQEEGGGGSSDSSSDSEVDAEVAICPMQVGSKILGSIHTHLINESLCVQASLQGLRPLATGRQR